MDFERGIFGQKCSLYVMIAQRHEGLAVDISVDLLGEYLDFLN